MIIVLDLGSSSTRAIAYDDAVQAIPGLAARAPVAFAVSEDGRSEDDAEAAFQRVVTVLDELHDRLTHLGRTGARPPDARVHGRASLAISSYASSLVCVDEHGSALTPVFTYADTRSADDARRLRQEHDEMTVLRRTGCRIRANYLPSKLAWIKRTRPEDFARARWFASLSDYVGTRLFGRMLAGVSVASWTGLLNHATSDWDQVWLDALGIARERLPQIAPDGAAAARGLASEWAARWPRFADLTCAPPVGDGAAANVGSGCADHTRIAITIGSTAALRVVRPIAGSHHEIEDPALWSYRVDHAHALIGGATTEGGNVFAWARAALQLPADVEHAISALQPDAHRLTILPTFAGERSPGYAENIQATLHGLTLDSSPAEIMRALMESIAYRLAIICDALRASGAASDSATLVGSGGALMSSPTWAQIITDACGVSLQLADVPEATSRGVALIARAGARGAWDMAATSAEALHTFEPDPGRHAIYRAAMARQQELYAKLVRSDG